MAREPRKLPSAEVIAAFGATGEPVPLEGGQGSAWRVGHTVLKPLDVGENEHTWASEALAGLRCDGFRVARARRAADGSFVAAGWGAWEWLEGRHEERRWADIVAAGDRFHAALAGIPRPAFIASRAHRWAVGDRVAWDDLPIEDFGHVKHVARLAAVRRPIELPSQLIHGDLGSNVLFADPLPPAIIDFSPSWRPAPYASAIVVGDALVWEGADRTILDEVGDIPELPQLLVRALIMRAVVDRLFRPDEPVRPDDADPYLPAVELACELAEAEA